MPIINRSEEKQLAPRPVSPSPAETSVDTMTVVSDFLKTENGLLNAVDGLGNLMFNRFEKDAGYEPELDMQGYEGFADDLRGANNSEHMAFLKNKIDKEREAQESFANADGLQKAAAIGSLIASDPLTYVPIGGTAYKTYRTSGRILEGALKTAGVGFAMETGNEALLQLNQVSRDIDESITNVVATTAVSSILGGAAGLLTKSELSDLSKRYEEDLTVPTENDLSSAGAAELNTTLEQEEIKGLNRTKKAFAKLPAFVKNPVWETAVSPNKTVRQFSEKLADLSLVKNKNTEFIASEASVESLMKSYEALVVPFYKDEKSLFKAYKQRAAAGLPAEERIGSGKNGELTRQEFNEQVWHAGINDDTHIVPEVQSLAQSARRNVFDPILKRSEEVGIFEDIDQLDIKTAKSWMKRMYDTEKIKANRKEFKEIVMRDLEEKRAASRTELNKVIAETGYSDDIIQELQDIRVRREEFRRKNFGKLTNGNDAAIRKLEKFDDQLDEIAAKIPDPEDLDLLRKLTLRADTFDEELDDIAEQLIDRITNVTGGRLPYDVKLEGRSKGAQKMGARGSAKKRVWNIDDEKIQDFLVKDVRALMHSHVRTMSADNELLGKFGTLDFDVIKRQVQEDAARQRSGKLVDEDGVQTKKELSNEELAEIDKQLNKDIRHLEAMWEKLRGTYAQPDDYSAPQHVLERTALGFNFMRLLGDVTASSFPDLMRPIMVHGFNRTYGKLMKTLMSDIDGLKMSIEEMKEIGTALDILTSTTTLRRFNMDEYTPASGKIDDMTNKGSAFFAMASGVNHWNAIMKTFAGISTQNRMLDGILEFAETGKLGRKEVENLASHGIDRDMAKRIAEQYKKHGETRKVLKIANARNWDAEVKNTFQAAIRKQVDEIIVTPALDRPLWLSRAGWRTVGQFKSFSFAATQRVTLAGMQQADANAFSGMSAMILLGSLVYAYKTKMAGREVSDDPRVWIAEGVDRSGVTGMFMDANNIIEKVTRGTVGINSMMGGAPMSRYASRNVTGALLGASFGMAQDLFQTTGAVFSGDIRASDVNAARKLAVGQNIPYTRFLFDAAEEGIVNTFGLE